MSPSSDQTWDIHAGGHIIGTSEGNIVGGHPLQEYAGKEQQDSQPVAVLGWELLSASTSSKFLYFCNFSPVI